MKSSFLVLSVFIGGVALAAMPALAEKKPPESPVSVVNNFGSRPDAADKAVRVAQSNDATGNDQGDDSDSQGGDNDHQGADHDNDGGGGASGGDGGSDGGNDGGSNSGGGDSAGGDSQN